MKSWRPPLSTDTANNILQVMQDFGDTPLGAWPLLEDLTNAVQVMAATREVPEDIAPGLWQGVMSGFIFGVEYMKRHGNAPEH